MYNRNMYITEDKYLPLSIEVEERPVIFVGQNPGKTRKGKYSEYVWDGDTRTSNLLREAVEGYTNIVLTNVCNYQLMSTENVDEGMEDLKKMLDDLEPRKVIALGSYAYLALQVLKLDFPVKRLNHPSFIVRFNRDREEYITKIRKELE